MSLSVILKKRRERAGLLGKAGALLTKAHKAGRPLTPTEAQTFDRMHAQGDKLLAVITDLEGARANVAALETATGMMPGQVVRAAEDVAAEVLAFRAWANGRPDQVRKDPKARAAAKRLGLNFGMTTCKVNRPATFPKTLAEATDRKRKLEERAMGRATGAGGDFGVPEGFHTEVDVALLQYGGMREVATVMRTATGQDLPMPTTNDSGNMGELLDENVEAGKQDVALGQLILEAYKYSSKTVLVSIELMQDEAIGLEALLGRLIGERLGRILNLHFTTGDGVGKPKGMLTASTLGKTAALAAALTRNELVDLKHSVDPAYRVGAGWMWHDTTLASVKKLVDSDGRPLWQAGIGEGEPDKLDGDPYVVNQDMPAIAASAKPVAYGQMSKYIVRDVMDLDLIVFRERYMELGQFGFLAFSRHDADLLDAGTNPVKHLQMAP